MVGAMSGTAGPRREYPDAPRVGVGVVVWRGAEVLLIKRGKPPRAGQWGLPGGLQELGETVFEAARREVLEETGVGFEPQAVVTVVDSITPDDAGAVRYHYTLVEVTGEWRSGEAVAADDAADARWAVLDDLEGLLDWPETTRVIRLAASLRDAGLARDR